MMSKHLFKPFVMFSILVAGFVLINPSAPLCASEDSAGSGYMLLDVGKAGSKAIEVNIGAKKSEPVASGKEEPVSVMLNPQSRAYVTALYISPQGDATVVFPNKKAPDNLLTPGKDYTIVSPDCGLKLGFSPSANKGKIVVYISPQPIELDQPKSEGSEDYVTIPHTDVNAINALAGRIAAISKDDQFNKKVITSETLSRLGQGDSIMGLPGGVVSSQPESVAGVQGVKGKIKALGKD